MAEACFAIFVSRNGGGDSDDGDDSSGRGDGGRGGGQRESGHRDPGHGGHRCRSAGQSGDGGSDDDDDDLPSSDGSFLRCRKRQDKGQTLKPQVTDALNLIVDRLEGLSVAGGAGSASSKQKAVEIPPVGRGPDGLVTALNFFQWLGFLTRLVDDLNLNKSYVLLQICTSPKILPARWKQACLGSQTKPNQTKPNQTKPVELSLDVTRLQTIFCGTCDPHPSAFLNLPLGNDSLLEKQLRFEPIRSQRTSEGLARETAAKLMKKLASFRRNGRSFACEEVFYKVQKFYARDRVKWATSEHLAGPCAYLLQLAFAPYDPERRTELLTDASRVGLGFVLIQFDETSKRWRLIKAGSTALKRAQRNYPPIQLELLGLMWALQSCNYYLRAHPGFLVKTDYNLSVGLVRRDISSQDL